MRRTKIVCTMGPSCRSPETVRRIIESGMDVARLNFSHGEHDEHRDAYERVRRAAQDARRNVAVMMDLQGPKIRTGSLKDGRPVELKAGSGVILTTDSVPGDATLLSTTYEALPRDVKPGDRIMMADGAIELHVEQVRGAEVQCRVVHGGAIGEHKGINLPGVDVSAPALTEKDIEDLAFGLDLGVDYVALSFVRTPEDILGLRERMRQHGRVVPIVAKIERPEAVTALEEILGVTDAVMVARGDLGVEMPLAEVPQVQKEIIRRANRLGKPVITATQMLESMMESPRPTRAEAADVANAIYDGTDAVMLSGETAAGRYPVEAVNVMAEVAIKADAAIAQGPPCAHSPDAAADAGDAGAFSRAIGHAVCHLSETLKTAHIVCFTMSGYTAAVIASFRPRIPITAITLSEEARRRCAMFWGVNAVQSVEVADTDAMVEEVENVLLEHRLARIGDPIVIVAGTPLAVAGRTNLMKLHTLGEKVHAK